MLLLGAHHGSTVLGWGRVSSKRLKSRKNAGHPMYYDIMLHWGLRSDEWISLPIRCEYFFSCNIYKYTNADPTLLSASLYLFLQILAHTGSFKAFTLIKQPSWSSIQTP